MGILSWITLRAEIQPSVQKAFLVGSERLENLLPFVYAVQRGLLGEQTFIIDRTVAAMLLANGDMPLFGRLCSNLPAWICLQAIAGFERLPRERLEYHLQDIGRFARQFDLHLEEQIGTVSADELFSKATQPCGEVDWRDALRGNSLSIFFLSTLDRTPALCKVLVDSALELGIPASEIGTYIQPIVQNHACQVEFIIPFSLADEENVTRIKQFERQTVIRLMAADAFFSRPYGSAAELVWKQNPANYQLVKTLKGIFDPRRVLQRGKWNL